MFNSQVLEIAIGLIFVYLIASMLATTVREIIESALKTRAVQLERGLRILLDDPSGRRTMAALFSHPQIFGLFDGVYDPARLTRHWRFWRRDTTTRDGFVVSTHARRLPFGSSLPSYIPSRNFALALLDLLGRQGTTAPMSSAIGAPALETLLAHANALTPSRLRDALLVALNEAQGNFDRARTSLEAWFDSNMDRVSGWYKRESQVILLVIGMLTAVAFDIDTIRITRELANNNTVRAEVVLQADALNAKGSGQQALQSDPVALAAARKGLGDLVGWEGRECKIGDAKATGRLCLGTAIAFWRAIGGWLLTAVAISLGAPFWFDLLNKIMVVRSTVKPFEKSPSEGSEDRPGSVPSADRLEPAPAAGAVAAGNAATSPPADTGGALTGWVRLAADMAGLSSFALIVDDQPFSMPASGYADIPLSMGDDHRLKITAKYMSGQAVSWSQVVRVTLDDDGQAIDAVLAGRDGGATL